MKSDESFTIDLVRIENPKQHNLIIGQSHFIKTVEDVHEALVNTVPGISFGLAFSEASAGRLIRSSGTDTALEQLAVANLKKLASGHVFIIFLGNAFPINVLRAIKAVPEIVHIFCATANPVQAVVARSSQGGGVLGVIDGGAPTGAETAKDRAGRIAFLRKIGYKTAEPAASGRKS